jgi:tripartite-type tricarboxylate transporter receptor subunit TctC
MQKSILGAHTMNESSRKRGMHSMSKLLRQASIAFFLVWIAQSTVAQDFPTKPVHFVVPFPPGGTADILMRILADPLSERWGKPVIVENRPGASTIIGSEIVARAPADGYMLLMNSASFLINPSLRPKMPYDAFKDFAPVMLLVNSPLVVVVNSSSPAKSLGALVDEARARPGQLSYATVGPGTTQQIIGEMLKLEAKIDLLYVPFAGGAPAVNAILGNHVAVVIANYSEVAQHLAAGTLRALAVASPARIDLLPEVPTISELGFKDVQGTVWFGIVAPAGTPANTITRIQTDLAFVLKLPTVRGKLVAQGLYPVGSTTDEFVPYMRAVSVRYEKVIQAAGIKAD